MTVLWAQSALLDLQRIYDFYDRFDQKLAQKTVTMLRSATALPATFPQAGKPCAQYLPRDVRDFIVGDYQIRYELLAKSLVILRTWHCKEDR